MVQILTFDTMAKAQHVHTCPGITLGYKIAVVAARWAGDAYDVHPPP